MELFEKKIKKYLKERDWDNLRPGDLAKSVAIESGELLEIFQWDNPTKDEIKKNPEKLEKIKKELADVMIYCFDISVTLGFNTEKILNDKLKKIIEKYPRDLFNKKTRDSDPGTEDMYWKIKEKYRKEGKN